jgi:hypothetical protein
VDIDQFFGFSGGPMGGGDIRRNTEMAEGAPVAIPIAQNLSGYWTYLICEGPLAGGVYHHDRESRSAWPDRLFYENFKELAPSIELYLELRRSGRLPRKSAALADFYRLADSFDEFLAGCRRAEEGEEPESG